MEQETLRLCGRGWAIRLLCRRRRLDAVLCVAIPGLRCLYLLCHIYIYIYDPMYMYLHVCTCIYMYMYVQLHIYTILNFYALRYFKLRLTSASGY